MYRSSFQQGKLSQIERDEIKNRTLALREEDKTVVVHNLNTTVLMKELDRRYALALKKLDMVNQTINNFANIEEPTLVDIQQYLKNLKEVLG